MTIEERAVNYFGRTEDAILATWLLADGTLLNGSYTGYQRDIDHRDIGQFFTRSCMDRYGDPTVYIAKFIRRGNIRINCSNCGYTVEYSKTPSKEQMKVLKSLAMEAEESGTQFGIIKRNRSATDFWRNPKVFYDFDDFYYHYLRYNDCA